MIVIEHEGAEYALITRNNEKSWINVRNKKTSDSLSEILKDIASDSGIPDYKLMTYKPKPNLEIKAPARRRRRKRGGISINVKLKNKEV